MTLSDCICSSYLLIDKEFEDVLIVILRRKWFNRNMLNFCYHDLLNIFVSIKADI